MRVRDGFDVDSVLSGFRVGAGLMQPVGGFQEDEVLRSGDGDIALEKLAWEGLLAVQGLLRQPVRCLEKLEWARVAGLDEDDGVLIEDLVMGSFLDPPTMEGTPGRGERLVEADLDVDVDRASGDGQRVQGKRSDEHVVDPLRLKEFEQGFGIVGKAHATCPVSISVG